MAELYVAQGRPRQALAIYRRVLQLRPDDATAANRLVELEQMLEATKGGRVDFRAYTKAMVEAVPGAVSCAIMGWDGIEVDSYSTEMADLDLPTLLVEYANAARGVKACNEVHPELGAMGEMCFTSAKLQAVIRPLTDEHILVVIMRPDALVGKARFLMRSRARQLSAEL